jgi:hypothetical protein
MNRKWLIGNGMRGIAEVLLLGAFVMLAPVHAASVAGVNMPASKSVDGKTLVLNGLGLRTATIFNKEVYVIGLYLEKKNFDANAIINSEETKRIRMVFLRDVSAKKLRDGWTTGFGDNYRDVGSIQQEIATFNASMRDVKSGDNIVIHISGDTTETLINDTLIDSVKGKTFQQALLGIWLGPKPPTARLKESLLGL